MLGFQSTQVLKNNIFEISTKPLKSPPIKAESSAVEAEPLAPPSTVDPCTTCGNGPPGAARGRVLREVNGYTKSKAATLLSTYTVFVNGV